MTNANTTKLSAAAMLAQCGTIAEILTLVHNGVVDVPSATKRMTELTQAARSKGALTFKVSETKKCLSVYGLQQRPVTLYAGQWLRLLDVDVVARLKQFIEDNRDALAWKESAD